MQAFLGRVLLAQNKAAAAKQMFEAILKGEPLPIQAYAYAHLGLGDLALQQSNFTEAATHFRCRVGLAIAVTDAVSVVLAQAHYVTQWCGGRGAVREVVELILKTQTRWDEVLRQF